MGRAVSPYPGPDHKGHEQVGTCVLGVCVCVCARVQVDFFTRDAKDEASLLPGVFSTRAGRVRGLLLSCCGVTQTDLDSVLWLPAEFPRGRPSAPACTPFGVLRNGPLFGFPLFVLGSFLRFHLPWGHRPHSSWGLGPAAHEGTSRTLPFWVPGLLSMAPRGRSPPCVVTLHSSHWAKQPLPSPMAAGGSLETLPCQWVLGFRPLLLPRPFCLEKENPVEITVCLTNLLHFALSSVLPDSPLNVVVLRWMKVGFPNNRQAPVRRDLMLGGAETASRSSLKPGTANSRHRRPCQFYRKKIQKLEKDLGLYFQKRKRQTPRRYRELSGKTLTESSRFCSVRVWKGATWPPSQVCDFDLMSWFWEG